jgi:hypothetical protein
LTGVPRAAVPGGHQAGRKAEPPPAHVIADLPERMLRNSRSYQPPWLRGGRGEKSPSGASVAISLDGRFKPRGRTGQVAGGSGDIRPGGDV